MPTIQQIQKALKPKERKTAKITVRLEPSLYSTLKAIAERQNTNLNELVYTTLRLLAQEAKRSADEPLQ